MTTRVEYRDSQILEAEDLIDEQVYRIAMRRRHNIAHHGWGIVHGLQLRVDPADPANAVLIEAGVAIDGYGRDLILPGLVTINVTQPSSGNESLFKRLDEPNGIDFWLIYQRHHASPPGGEADCAATKFSRIEENAAVRCSAATEIDPRRPQSVPEDDYDFPPHREPPDDPESHWPVFLGRVCFTDIGLEAVHRPIRPYATLIGGAVDGISQRVRMQLTDEARDQTRFSIQLQEPAPADGDVAPDNAQPPRLTDRLVIARNNDISIMSPCRIEGMLELGCSGSIPGNAPTLRTPINGGTIAVQLPTFTWFSVLGAETYELLIKKIEPNGQFPVVKNETNIKATPGNVQSFQLADALPDPLPGNYRWWVRANVAEVGADSAPLEFTIPQTSPVTDGTDQTAPTEITEPEVARRKSARSPRDAHLVFDPAAEPSPVARPWHLYRADVASEEQPKFEELRLELPAGTDTVDPDRQAFVLGHFEASADEQPQPQATPKVEFVPSLAVLASDTVIVDSLDVRGQLVTGPIPPDPTDKRFRRALVENWARGHLAGSSALRANSLDMNVDLSNESGIKSTITIFNPLAEPVTITDLIAAYSSQDEEQKTEDYFIDFPALRPISISANGESDRITDWPPATKPDGTTPLDLPLKLVVSAIGRSATNAVVFGRSSDEL